MDRVEAEMILTLITEDKKREMETMKNAMKAAIAEVFGGTSFGG